METMHFNIAHTKFVFRTTLFRIQGVPLNEKLSWGWGDARKPKLDAGVFVNSSLCDIFHVLPQCSATML